LNLLTRVGESLHQLDRFGDVRLGELGGKGGRMDEWNERKPTPM
jgi:hypothetical protein